MEESGISFVFPSFIKLGSFPLRCIHIANFKLELVACPAFVQLVPSARKCS